MREPTEKSAAKALETFADLLGWVKPRVDRDLEVWLAPRVARAADIGDVPAAAASSLAALTLRGGKRLRAALVAVGRVAFGSDDDSVERALGDVRAAMIAIELMQTYLLIHDDWMDGDVVRRGGPSVHADLRRRLGEHRGDAAAILAGDLASAYAHEALFESTASSSSVVSAARAFAKMHVDVVTGQITEMSESSERVREPRLETIHALKTATYTVTGPLSLGAALSGAKHERWSNVEAFGRPLGVAFQLRDDLLDLSDDSERTGKPRGRDVCADFEERIQSHVNEALRALSELRITSMGRRWLEGATRALAVRST